MLMMLMMMIMLDDDDNDDDGNNNGCVLSYTEYSLHNIHREMEVRRGIDPTALKVIFIFNFCSLNFNDWVPTAFKLIFNFYFCSLVFKNCAHSS